MAVTNNVDLGDIAVLGSQLGSDVQDQVVSAKYSVSTTSVGQLDITIQDPHLRIMESGLIKVNQRVTLMDMKMVIASVSTQDQNGIPAFNFKARSYYIHTLKMRQGALVMNNASPTDFVKAECKAVGCRVIAQSSDKRAQVSRDVQAAETAGVTQYTDPSTLPSSWTTFQRLAKESGFIMFEANNTVYFGQPTWLIDNGEKETVLVDLFGKDNNSRPLQTPQCTRSIDSKDGVTISVSGPQFWARTVRPGFKFNLKNVPTFDKDDYIVNSLSFNVGAKETTCDIGAQTPINPVPTYNPDLGGGGGLYSVTDPHGYNFNLSGLHFSFVNSSQVKNAAIIVGVAKHNGMSERDAIVGITTAFQESGIANLPYGDRDSVGMFQQRPSQGWGTRQQCMDPYYSSNKFFGALKKVSGRNSMSYAAECQAVQRSAFPEAYAKWQSKATTLEKALWPRVTIVHKPSNNVGGPRHGTKSAADFVYWAQKQLGDRYIFGYPVNTKDPNPSIFDCSGLVEWAAAQVGISLPHQSEQQYARCYHDGVTKAIATRGALLWQPGHIAISLGNGKTIEAENERVGVISDNARGRGWGGGGRIIGMNY